MTTTLTTDWKQLHSSAFSQGKALVTGGAGFIGSHLTEALLTLGASVVVMDDLSGSSIDNLTPLLARFPDKLRFEQGSILDPSLLASAATGAQWVFHQAALGSVPRSVEQPELYTRVNVLGTLNVLQAARAAGAKRVMFAASSSAYGESPTLPKIEHMPTLSKSPYAATKVAGEALLSAYAGSYGLDTVSLRYFNIFGPRQNANSAYAAVIASFAKALLAGQRPVIFGDGSQSRDFTFVHNAVHANLLAARSAAPLNGDVINVACGSSVTVSQLAQQMAQLLGKPDLTAEHKPQRAGDVKHSLADLSRAKQRLGYAPIVGFDQGLQATTFWYRDSLS